MGKRNSTELLDPLLEESTETTMRAGITDPKNASYGGKLLAACYSFFLCWQLSGMLLYGIRAVECLKLKVATYKCEANAAFPHSAEFQVCSLVTRSLHIVTAIVILQKIADFPGCRSIFRQLKVLPDFWLLLFPLLVASFRYAILLAVFDKALFHVIALCFLNNIVRVAAVTILNFTRLNILRDKYSRTVFVFSKLTLLVFLMESLLSFVITLLQFAVKIEEFSQDEIKNSTDFQAMYSLMDKFATTSFYFKIMKFFWLKLFVDDKNLLASHYSSLSR